MADEAAAAGREDDEADETVFKMEAELDRCLLRLIAAACKGTRTRHEFLYLCDECPPLVNQIKIVMPSWTR